MTYLGYETSEFNTFNVIVMELAEASLLSKKDEFGLIDLVDCQKVLIQVILGLKEVHEAGFLYCNIQPSNIVLKRASKGQAVQFNNFRFITKIGDAANAAGVKAAAMPQTNKNFMSRAAHRDEPLSIKDELETLIYLLMDLYNGYLPWQALVGSPEETNTAILRMKEQMFAEKRFEGLPRICKSFLKALLYLKKDEAPDYDQLIEALQQTSDPSTRLDLSQIYDISWNEYMCDIQFQSKKAIETMQQSCAFKYSEIPAQELAKLEERPTKGSKDEFNVPILYKGQWDKETQQPHGHGIQIWQFGGIYLGSFAQGQRAGKGRYIHTNGDYQEGFFIDGVMQGHGIKYYKNGDVFQGEFVNDWPN